MQVVERDKFKDYLPSWDYLKASIASVTRLCAAHNVPTMYVALVPADGIPLLCGTYRDVNKELIEKHGWRLAAMEERFDMPVKDSDLVGIKKTISAHGSPAILNFVRQRRTSKVILTGVQENWLTGADGFCVSETARDFAADGFDTVVVADATNAFTNCSPMDMESRRIAHGRKARFVMSRNLKPELAAFAAPVRDSEAPLRAPAPHSQTILGL
jgi:nicotinamidase-related amidase